MCCKELRRLSDAFAVNYDEDDFTDEVGVKVHRPSAAVDMLPVPKMSTDEEGDWDDDEDDFDDDVEDPFFDCPECGEEWDDCECEDDEEERDDDDVISLATYLPGDFHLRSAC